MSFYNTGNPVPSDDPRDLDDNAKHIDEIVNSTELSTTDRQGRAIRTLAGLQYDASQGTLRTDLAAPDGASLVGLKPNAIGTVVRTVAELGADFVSTKTYGAIGDGQYHPLSERFATLADAQAHYPTVYIPSLAHSLDYAGTQAALMSGRGVLSPAGAYLMTGDLLSPIGSRMMGENTSQWDTVFPPGSTFHQYFQKLDVGASTTWYAYNRQGTFEKKYKQNHITNCSKSGGVLVIGGLSHELLDFTNKDSVAGAPATPRLYSRLLGLSPESSVSNIRFLPFSGTNGLDGYEDGVTHDLADDVDSGIDTTFAWRYRVVNCQMVGYWRDAGALISVASDYDGVKHGNGERGYFQNCLFQGMRGWAVRGMDRTKVIANTSTTFTVPWTTSFTLTKENQLRVFGSGGTQTISFTGYTFDGGAETVTFTGCAPAIVGTSFECNVTPSSNGLSFFSMVDCYAAGLEHSSGLRADQLGLGVSAPFEISGAQIRQPFFQRFKAQTHESSGGIFHDCIDVRADGFQVEGKDSSTTYLRASPHDSGPNVITPYQRGSTDGLWFPDIEISGSVNRTYFDKLRGGWNIVETLSGKGITDPDFPLDFGNWRDGPLYLRGFSGTRFLKVPAASAALQDLAITSGSYGLTTSATDVNLQMKGSANLSIRDSSNATKTKFLQSGRIEFTNGLFPSVDQGATLGNNTNRMSDVRAMRGAFSGPVQPGQFTLATLPSAAGFTGYEIDVTDATGGPKRCRSNGSVWQILNTTTTVS